MFFLRTIKRPEHHTLINSVSDNNDYKWLQGERVRGGGRVKGGGGWHRCVHSPTFRQTHLAVFVVDEDVPGAVVFQVGDLKAVGVPDLLRLEGGVDGVHLDHCFGLLCLLWSEESESFYKRGKKLGRKEKKKKTLAPRKEPKTVRDSQKMINLKKKKRVCAGMSRYVCVWNVDWKLFFFLWSMKPFKPKTTGSKLWTSWSEWLWTHLSWHGFERFLYLGRQTHLPPTPPTGRSNSDVQTGALGFRLSSEFGLKHSWT